jgi:glutathione peroxidase
MLRCISLSLTMLVMAAGCAGNGSAGTKGGNKVSSLYDIPLVRITGEAATLREYAGKALLIVNVASKCGFTGQYAGLQALHEKYADRGLVVLGFPANDFLGQEPGTEAEIQQFCSATYGVTFPMFEKIVVKEGADQHPLYRFLTDQQTNPAHAGKITWNFNKFLVGRDGTVVNRFGSRTKPDAKELVAAIKRVLEAR